MTAPGESTLFERARDEDHKPDDARSAVATLRLHTDLLLQMTLSRAVDSFLRTSPS